MTSQPSWIHVWNTGELIRTLNSHHPNITRGNFFKGATQQCFKDLLDLCHRALCPIISSGSCIWSHKDIFRSMLAGKMGKLQRTCGAKSLSSTRLDLLLTAVTWGHAWTDRLLSHPLLDCGDTHASLYPRWAPAFTFTHTPLTLVWQSPFTQQNHTHHILSTCLLGYTISHTPLHVCTLRHTHFTEGPSPCCPSIWPVPFVPHALLAVDRKLLWAGGAVGPHDGSICPDLLKTYVMTWDVAFAFCSSDAPQTMQDLMNLLLEKWGFERFTPLLKFC